MASKKDKIIGIIVACFIGLACIVVIFRGDYYDDKAKDKFEQGEYYATIDIQESESGEQETEQKQEQEPEPEPELIPTPADSVVSPKATEPYLISPASISNIELALYSEDIFCIYDGEYYGYIDRTGNEITGFVYDMAYPFSEELACAMIDGIYGYVNKNGEVAIPFNYLDAAPFSEGLAYFATEYEYGFLNKDGTVAFTLNCDSVSSFMEDRAYFSIDGEYGYIDKKGIIVIEPKYQDAAYFKDGLAIVKNNGLFGMINKDGKEVIPIQYDNISHIPDKIVAELNGSVKYFDFLGNDISDEVIFEEDSSVTTTEEADDYTVIEEDDTIIIQDKEGNTVFSTDCNWARPIYGNDNYKVIVTHGNSDSQDRILVVNDSKGYDISQVLLQNRITLRKPHYWKLSHGKYVNLSLDSGEMEEIRKYNIWDETNYIKHYKLYDIEQSGNPILYCVEEPCFQPGFTLSDSAFYSCADDKLQCLLTGYECGGSARGDYVCLWKDVTTGEEYLGTRGFAGGFGGYASWGNICEYNNGVLNTLCSFDWVGQTTGNYSDEELLNNPHLFYDDNDTPYTKETILTTDSVNEYLVNGEQTTLEEYQKYYERYLSYIFLK